MTWPVPYDTRLKRHANRLKAAVRVAHDKVLRAIRHDGTLVGMGTTVVGLIADRTTAAVAHVGDSRAYRMRGGKFELLTQDHTWVNEQVVAGYLRRAARAPAEERGDARARRRVRVLVDARKSTSSPAISTCCSDGLTTMLSDTDIEDHTRRAPFRKSSAEPWSKTPTAAGSRQHHRHPARDRRRSGRGRG